MRHFLKFAIFSTLFYTPQFSSIIVCTSNKYNQYYVRTTLPFAFEERALAWRLLCGEGVYEGN